MFFLIEQVIAVVIVLLAVITIAIVLMVVVAIQRRQFRERYFERLDRLRQEYGPVVGGVLEGKVDYRQGLERLKHFEDRDRMLLLERLCLERRTPPEQLATLQRLCHDLGLVEYWQKRLTSKKNGSSYRERLLSAEGLLIRLGRLQFLIRAKSAESLGLIRHQPSWPLLVEALQDPHPDVQAVAMHALALIGEPQSFPTLVARLQAVVLDSSTRVSLRAVKTAVVSFPLKMAPGLAGSLRHPHRRIRFLATDVIREMVEREASTDKAFTLDNRLPRELLDLFLNALCRDQNPDVRARIAPVLAYLDDPRGLQALLALLQDPQWFVRLHAVRAMAKPRFVPHVDNLVARLSDTHWMVREAAVQTLSQLERLDRLCESFLATQDRYGKEQIADEWQRAGVISQLVWQYAQASREQETRVLQQLVAMGKTSYMLAVVVGSRDAGLQKKFLRDFGRTPDLQIQYWVSEVAARSPDPELAGLAKSLLPPPPKR